MLLISFGHLVHDVFTAFLAPILPLLIAKFSLSYAAAGLISVMLRMPSLLNPLVGAYIERWGLRKILVVCPAATAVGMCLMGAAPSYYAVLLLAAITSISTSLFHVPAPVLVQELAGRRVGAALSAFQMGGELARTVGPLLVLGALTFCPLERLYLLTPIGFLASALLYWRLRDLPRGRVSPGLKAGGAVLDTLRFDRTLFWGISGIVLSKCLTASIMATFLPAYLMAKGERLWFAGVALSIVEAAALVGVLLSGTLSDRIGRKRILVGLTAATPVAMLFFLYSSGWLRIPALILTGLSAFTTAPVILALIQRRGFPYPSVANGIYFAINFALGSAIVLLAGKLSDAIGMEATFRAMAVCSCVGLPFALRIEDR
ncbi:MFS transporter [Elusimicrobiota bacterium]